MTMLPTNQHNQSGSREAFTLPEVLVAMAVLTLVIFAATNLVVSIIRSNTQNIQTLTAYGLAQEGLEGMRNIRDSNWLLGADFYGEVGIAELDVWGEALPSESGQQQIYTLQLGVMERSPAPIQKPTELLSYMPWKLRALDNEDAEATRLYTFENEVTGEVRYAHEDTFSLGGEPTPFRRHIVVENVTEESASGTDALRVTSIVRWEGQGSTEREVALSMDLTDWNKGQL